MNPLDYLKKHGKEHVQALCKRCGTTYSYYRVVAYGGGQFSGPLSKKFSEETAGEMSLQELRPDIFGAPPPPAKPGRAKAAA